MYAICSARIATTTKHIYSVYTNSSSNAAAVATATANARRAIFNVCIFIYKAIAALDRIL